MIYFWGFNGMVRWGFNDFGPLFVAVKLVLSSGFYFIGVITLSRIVWCPCEMWLSRYRVGVVDVGFRH